MQNLFIAFLLIVVSAASANAEEWARLPDGRVVIDIQDERLAFTTTEYDLNYIDFKLNENASKKAEKAGVARLSLGEVLKRPELAKEIFADNGVLAVLALPPLKENKNGVLTEQPWAQGMFKPSTLAREFGAGWRTFYIWFGEHRAFGTPMVGAAWAVRPCNYDLGNSRLLVTEKDDDGYRVVKYQKGKDRCYSLPANERGFKTSREFRLECRPKISDGAVNVCSAWFYGTKRGLQIGYSFNDSAFPKPQWKALDKRMHDFYSHIILSQEIE